MSYFATFKSIGSNIGVGLNHKNLCFHYASFVPHTDQWKLQIWFPIDLKIWQFESLFTKKTRQFESLFTKKKPFLPSEIQFWLLGTLTDKLVISY